MWHHHTETCVLISEDMFRKMKYSQKQTEQCFYFGLQLWFFKLNNPCVIHIHLYPITGINLVSIATSMSWDFLHLDLVTFAYNQIKWGQMLKNIMTCHNIVAVRFNTM